MVLVSVLVYFFFFKQKTAYEMRISDWSSDVCSSDLLARIGIGAIVRENAQGFCFRPCSANVTALRFDQDVQQSHIPFDARVLKPVAHLQAILDDRPGLHQQAFPDHHPHPIGVPPTLDRKTDASGKGESLREKLR